MSSVMPGKFILARLQPKRNHRSVSLFSS